MKVHDSGCAHRATIRRGSPCCCFFVAFFPPRLVVSEPRDIEEDKCSWLGRGRWQWRYGITEAARVWRGEHERMEEWMGCNFIRLGLPLLPRTNHGRFAPAILSVIDLHSVDDEEARASQLPSCCLVWPRPRTCD